MIGGHLMAKKKLLVTASTFPRWEGDTEPRFVLDLCKHMTEWFDITIMVPYAPGAKEKETLEGMNVIRYHYFPVHKWETLCYPGAIVPRIREKKIRVLLVPFLFIALYYQLFRRLSSFDIVHVHWIIPQGIVQSFFNKPYVVTGHGGDVTSLNKGIVKRLKIRCLNRAGHVTVVSDYLRKRILELTDVPQIDVISMGVNVSSFGKQYFCANYFGQGEKKVVLFVGRLAEKKGVTYLISAMAKVDAMLVIVGEGTLKKELQEQARKLNVNAVFWGSKTHDELKKIYASADVFVAPSVTAKDGDQEGLGLVMLEAMASGLPVIASDSGGISQVVEDGVNGLLCPEKDVERLADSIAAVLQNDELGGWLSGNGMKMVKRYDYATLAEKYALIMSGMLEGSREERTVE